MLIVFSHPYVEAQNYLEPLFLCVCVCVPTHLGKRDKVAIAPPCCQTHTHAVQLDHSPLTLYIVLNTKILLNDESLL